MTDYRIVPVEPTPEMVEAAQGAYMPFGDMEMAIRMAVLAAPAVQEEPVAYLFHDEIGRTKIVLGKKTAELLCPPYESITPLYTAPQPAPQPLTDEHKVILKECRNQAMRWTLDARIPEAGAFGGIAQDLDYLCAQLGVKNKPTTAPQPAEQQPCPEDIREGAPYDDPAFESLCREHEIWGTAAAALCAVFWEAGKRGAEQQAATDVAKMQRKLEASFQREEQLEREVRELKRERFKRFSGQECWMWAGDGSDRLETLTCPVVITPAELMAIINRAAPATDMTGLVEALELARRTLAMAALEGEVTRRIDSALAAHRKQQEGQP